MLKKTERIFYFIGIPIIANIIGALWSTYICSSNLGQIKYILPYNGIGAKTAQFFIYVFPYIVMILIGRKYYKPVRDFIVNQEKRELFTDEVKAKIINSPLQIGKLISLGWVLGGIAVFFDLFFNYSYSGIDQKIYILIAAMLKMVTAAVFSLVINYYLMEYFKLRLIIPKIFPEGLQEEVKGSTFLSIRKKMTILFMAICLYPVSMLAYLFIENTQNKLYSTSILIGASVLVIIGGILTYIMSKTFQKPLILLKNALKEIEKGNYDIKLNVNSTDEIGGLSYSINHVAGRLKEYVAENNEMAEKMMELNRNLEEKVEERTKELQDAQNNLIINEKMAAVGNLAAGIAHELNSPIGSILTSVQMIMDDVKYLDNSNIDEIKTSINESIEIIEMGARKSSDIIQMLLKSRERVENESGDKAHKQDIKEILIGIVKGFDSNEIYRKKNIKSYFEFESGIMVYGSKVTLNTAFGAIIKNSLEAMIEDNIKNKKLLTIKTYIKEELIYIEIEDNGIGMTEETKMKVFDPFFTTKQVGGGMGLGLTISFDIIQKCGGKIEIESTVNRGTKVTVIFPVY